MVNYTRIILFTLLCTFISYGSFAKGQTEFDKFSKSFSHETAKAEKNIIQFSGYAAELSGYENRMENLSNADYAKIEKILSNAPTAKTEAESSIQSAKDIGRSVTSDGYNKNTADKVQGWDTSAYTNIHVEQTLSNLDKSYSDAIIIYNTIDPKLLKRPNKPFNPSITRLIKNANIEIISAKSDIAAKNWESGKDAVDRANSNIKDAVKLDANDVELYQISMLQDDLKKVSNEIALWSTLNKASSVVEDATRGTMRFLGGVGEIILDAGKKLVE